MTAKVKWMLRGVIGLIALYFVLCGGVLLAMMQPPGRFGRIIKFIPAPIVWGALPAKRMWLWARAGGLSAGDLAPDFTLPALDHRSRVTLSSFRGRSPVVLVFGSYT